MKDRNIPCDVCRDLLAAEEWLSAEGRSAVAEHLAGCPDCRSLHGDLAALALPLADDLPADFTERVMGAIQVEDSPVRSRGLFLGLGAIIAAEIGATVLLRPDWRPARVALQNVFREGAATVAGGLWAATGGLLRDGSELLHSAVSFGGGNAWPYLAAGALLLALAAAGILYNEETTHA